MIPTYEPWAEEDVHNELPEVWVRCGCGRAFEISDGCSHCDGTDEAEMGVAS